ncbi:hypothetical protein FOT62_21475 [Serratia marcescens]|uniref:Conjugal transfer protein TraP n=1 Tax=Serratia marcescens TaxID=615 RepID=A0A5C7C441_SERMA|nr:hypothetical protein [Serratia marcescens]TXE28338.1 hypothetical protein FOT62_21475 [Serratia marcescens]TXE56854.1 hypothetical protein FOT56_23580 [Serratia marcescens]
MSHFDMDDPELPPALHVDEPTTHPLPEATPSGKKMIKLPLLGNVTLLQLGLMAAGLIAIVLFAALRGGPKHPATAPTFATQVATPQPAPSLVMESSPVDAPLPAPVPPEPVPASIPASPPAENQDVTALNQTVDGQRGDITRNRTDIDALTRRVDALEKARTVTATSSATAGHTPTSVKTTRHRTASAHRRQTTYHAHPGGTSSMVTAYHAPPATLWRGARIESLYPELAWVKYRDSTWALRPGDTLDNVTVLKIDTLHRTVVTTAGTLR